MEPLKKVIARGLEPVDCIHHGTYTPMFMFGRETGCPNCADEARRRGTEEQRQQHLASVRRRCWEDAGIPERQAHAKLDDLEPAVRQRIEAWVSGACERNPACLILLGHVGTGKSFAAAAAVRAACDRTVQCVYTTVSTYLRRLRETWDNPQARESEVFAYVTIPRILVLDEIGLGLKTDKDGQRIHEVISERYDRMLPMVLASNLTAEELRATLGERAYDRVREGATLIAMTGNSRRGKPA